MIGFHLIMLLGILNISDRSISLLFIFNFGKRSGISSLLLGFRKNEYFVLLIFSDSLLEINH